MRKQQFNHGKNKLKSKNLEKVEKKKVKREVESKKEEKRKSIL